MKLRVGVIGLNQHWESRYRSALRALSNRFIVQAVCDQVAHRAEQAARDFDARVVHGYRALVEREDVDAVLLLASRWYGSLPILAASDVGKSVYCASPLEPKLDEIRQIKERVNRSGIAFLTERFRRFAPATVRLKELIATRLGKPRLLFCHLRQQAEKPAVRALPAHDIINGAARSDLTELVDWCCYVVGRPPQSVFGTINRLPGDRAVEDYEMMSLDFSEHGPPGTGPMAQISCGRYVPAGWQEAVTFRPPTALQVACERGIAFVDLPNHLIWFDDAGRHLENLENERPIGEQLLLQFYRDVTSLVRQSSAVEDAYQVADIVLKARQSHAQGQRLFLAGEPEAAEPPKE